MDVIKNYSERLTLVEAKLDSISNTTTPRTLNSSMYRLTNSPSSLYKNNDDN